MLAGTLLTVALLQAATPAAPPVATQETAPAAPTLTEVERLRVENHTLRVRLAQLETQMATQALSAERYRLSAAIAAAYPGWAMGWSPIAIWTGIDG